MQVYFLWPVGLSGYLALSTACSGSREEGHMVEKAVKALLCCAAVWGLTLASVMEGQTKAAEAQATNGPNLDETVAFLIDGVNAAGEVTVPNGKYMRAGYGDFSFQKTTLSQGPGKCTLK
jgi:hypothetical protein